MNRLLILLVFGVAGQLLPFGAYAQCNNGASACGSATPINCFPFTASTAEQIGNPQPFPGCGGGFSLDNPAWYQIQVSSTGFFLLAEPNCNQGNGFQMGLYTDCDPASPQVALQCSCAPGPVTLGSTTAPPGIYFLMVDGCQGNICDISLELIQGTVEPIKSVLGQIETPVSDINNVCPGEIITFTVNNVGGAEAYDWIIPPGATLLSSDCNTATVLWGSQPGQVQVTATSFCLGQSVTSPAVQINMGNTNGFAFGEYCFPEEPGYFYPTLGIYFPAGIHQINLLSTRGCDSIVTLNVVEFNTPPNFINATLCDGESIIIAGNVYDFPTTDVITLPSATQYGCDSVIIVTIDASPTIFVSASVDDANCNTCNGRIDVNLSGGTPPFFYEWSNGLTGIPIDGLCEGTYEVIITDIIGCTAIETFTVGSSTGTNLSIAGMVIAPQCAGECNGSIELDISCGTPPFEIEWDNGIAPGTTFANNLCAGQYSVRVTDSIGLSSTEVFIIDDPVALDATYSTVDASCFGSSDGIIDLLVLGGSPPYNFIWNIQSAGNTPNLTGLSAGNYEVIIEDANGCTRTQSVTIFHPDELDFTLAINNVSCSEKGGAAVIINGGGTPPFTYEWSNGATGSTVTDLEFGVYSVNIFDANFCISTQDFVIENDCCELAISLEATAISCGGQDDGTLKIVIDTAGIPPYTIEWSDDNLPNEEELTGLPKGDYSVTVTDASGCSAIDSVRINEQCCPGDFIVNVMNESCQGINDGSALVEILNSNIPPYSYEWSDPSIPNTPSADNLSPGTYMVTITNGDGCAGIDTFVIKSSLNLEVTTTPADCEGLGGTATASADGFFLSFFWSNGGSGNTQQGLATGEYSVTVYSLFGGCRSAADFTIEEEEDCPDDLIIPSHLGHEVQTEQSAFSMTLSPNPTAGQGQIRYQLTQPTEVTISLYDGQGRLLRQLERQAARSAGEHIINTQLSNLAAGIYFVQLQTKAGVHELRRWIKTD